MSAPVHSKREVPSQTFVSRAQPRHPTETEKRENQRSREKPQPPLLDVPDGGTDVMLLHKAHRTFCAPCRTYVVFCQPRSPSSGVKFPRSALEYSRSSVYTGADERSQFRRSRPGVRIQRRRIKPTDTVKFALVSPAEER
eukprot:902433-Prorocentrum_minimum.AAC.1